MLYRVTYKDPGAVELQVKHFKNRQVADSFIVQLGGRFLYIEEVEDDATDES